MKKPELIKVKARTFLFVNDKKVKMIPVNYQELDPELIHSFIADFDAIYLNNSERFLCELHLFKEALKINEPYVFELIKSLDVSECRLVSVKFGHDRAEILFENGTRVKCNSLLCDLYHYKKNIKSLT